MQSIGGDGRDAPPGDLPGQLSRHPGVGQAVHPVRWQRAGAFSADCITEQKIVYV